MCAENSDKYDFLKKEFEREKEESLKFYKIIKIFKQLSYEERVEYIKQLFGKIECKSFYFGKSCKLEITQDTEDKKYHFSFRCEGADTNTFKENFPEMYEDLKNNDINAIKQKYPEIQDFTMPEENGDENIKELETNYLNAYNNIKINRRNEG